jgi:hypothetical protein
MVRWEGHVASLVDIGSTYEIMFGNLEGRYHFGDADINGKMLSRWI